MDFEIYRKFAEYVLADRATTKSQLGRRLLPGQRRMEIVNGHKQRVPMSGAHIAYTSRMIFSGPDGVIGERFRGHDGVLRESLARMAYENYYRAKTGKERGATWNACLMISEYEARHGAISRGRRRGPRPKTRVAREAAAAMVLPTKPPVTERRDPRFAELDAMIAAEERDRHAPKQPLELVSAARHVQKKTDAFRARLGDLYLNQMFNGWFGAFRSQFCRDAEWCIEQEPVYKARVETASDYLDPTEGRDRPEPPSGIPVERWELLKRNGFATRKRDVAMAVVNLAGLYHQQGRYAEAAAQYRRAIQIYESASIPESLRQAVVTWIPAQIANCQAGRELDRSPVIKLS